MKNILGLTTHHNMLTFSFMQKQNGLDWTEGLSYKVKQTIGLLWLFSHHSAVALDRVDLKYTIHIYFPLPGCLAFFCFFWLLSLGLTLFLHCFGWSTNKINGKFIQGLLGFWKKSHNNNVHTLDITNNDDFDHSYYLLECYYYYLFMINSRNDYY